METQNAEKRFVDNGDGTVSDLETKLMWRLLDAFQDTGKFMNWYESKDYVRDLNIKKSAGFDDWRLPTLAEAQALYTPEQSIRDVYRFEIFIPACFKPGGGFSTWTSEVRPFDTALVFYYRHGYEERSNREGLTKDTVRPVRSLS